MANRVFINNKGFVECRVIGDQNLKSVTAMGQQIEALLSELENMRQPLLILDDITKIGRVPSNARKAVIQFVKNLQYDRLAMVGDNGIIRLGANLIFRASGRGKKVKFFSNHAQAVRWLQGQEESKVAL